MNTRDCFKEGLLRKTRPSQEMAEKELRGSERYLENARKCLEAKMPEMAVVAVYTAMFHTSRAILFRDGIRERSHICVIFYLLDKYPGLKSHLKTMDIYRRGRHMMLYGIELSAAEEDAREGISAAEEYLKVVEKEIEKTKAPGK